MNRWIIFLFFLLIENGFAYSKFVKGVYSLPITFDPIKMNDTSSLLVSNLIYEGLLKFTGYLEIKGAIAKNWTTSPDGKKLTFYLDKNKKFHNGKPVLASDVVFSLKRNLSNESLVRKFYDCIEGVNENTTGNGTKEIGIREKDSHTVEIILKYPFPAFLNVLAGATAKILPKSHLNDVFFNHPIGSGPFVYAHRSGNEITFVSNPSHERTSQKITHFVIRESPENEAILLAKKGKVHDLANWPLSSNNEIFKLGKRITSPVAATWIIGLNTKKEPFVKQDIRQKFKDDFDSEKFRSTFYPDAYPAFGYIPPGLPGYRANAKNDKEITPSKSSPTLIEIAIPIELESHKKMGTLIKEMMAKKGWRVKPVYLDWKTLMEGYTAKTLQAFLVSMNMDYPDPEFLLQNFESHNPDNFSGLNNPEIDHLLKIARMEKDRIKRKETNTKLIELIDNASVTINLFHPRANYWVSNCVKNFKSNILSDVYIDYSEIEIEDCK